MTTPDPSREAFEKHILKIGDTGLSTVGMGTIARLASGDYEKASTQERWLTWQAAMAHIQADRGAAQNSPESEQTRMDAGSTVLPNQAYRMLIPDVDIIRPDDEYLSDDTTKWEPVGRGIFVGMPHLRAFKPGRRKIEGST